MCVCVAFFFFFFFFLFFFLLFLVGDLFLNWVLHLFDLVGLLVVVVVVGFLGVGVCCLICLFCFFFKTANNFEDETYNQILTRSVTFTNWAATTKAGELHTQK